MASRSSSRPRTLPLKQQPEQQQPLRAKWTKPLTEVLANLIVDQVHKGNRQKHSFSKKAWTSITDDFYKKTSLAWDTEQLKNRFAVLKRQYGIVKLLLEQDCFRWDQTTGNIMAEDEFWNRFIKEHPDAETVKIDGCSIYPQLCVIFSESGTNGVSNEAEALCPEPLSIFKEEFLSEPEDNLKRDREQDKFRPLLSPNSRKRGRKGVDCAIADAILEMAAASKLRASTIKKYSDKYSVKDCVRVLDEMKGIDKRVYNAALDLFKNRYARELFLSLKDGKRFDWLRSKCSGLPGSQP